MSRSRPPARRPFAALALLALLALAPALPARASVESEIAFHRGVVAYGDGRFDEARAEFEKVLAEDPEDGAAIHYLGLIAQAQGDADAAVAQYERALALDPADTDVRLDLGIALLEAGRLPEARRTLDEVLAAEPDRAQAHLFAGIAAYRAGDYGEAVPHLDRAVELDPQLRAHARYYSGLSQAFLGNIPAAQGAFEDVEQSPVAPLARSAGNLREQLEEREPRRWALSLTAGGEYDSNPTLAGRGLNQSDDMRGVFRASASYDVFQNDRFDLTAGYDGYWSLHEDADEVDLQTHVAWASGGYTLDPFRFSLRYDYAYTFISISDPFRSLNRVTPAVSWRQGTWGVSQLYYQFQNREFLRNLGISALNRDGTTHAAGANQFFFLPDVNLVSYLRVGALGEHQETDGSEFQYDGWEVSAGGGLDLPFEVTFSALYRFTQRFYEKNSVFTGGEHRDDYIHRLTVEAVRPIGDHLEISIGGSFRFQDSDVGVYDFNRHVVGSYLTYRF